MPWFAFIGHDGPRGLELRKLHRPAHLAGLEELESAGRLRHAGPLLGDDAAPLGSLVLFEAADLAAAGLREGQRVDVTSHFRGETRCVRDFRLVAYDVPRGCAAAYFPEANPLVAIDSVADGSHTPTYKSIEVSLAPAAAAD